MNADREQISEIDELKLENKELKKRLETQLLRWEECEGIFVTTKEKELRDTINSLRAEITMRQEDLLRQIKLQQINHNGHVEIRLKLLYRIEKLKDNLKLISDPTPPHPGRPSFTDWELRHIARGTINYDDDLEKGSMVGLSP